MNHILSFLMRDVHAMLELAFKGLQETLLLMLELYGGFWRTLILT